MAKNNDHQLMFMNFFSQFLKDLPLKDNRKIQICRKNLLRLQTIMIKTPLILLVKCLETIKNKMIIKKINKEKLHGVDSLPGKVFIELKLMAMQNLKNSKITSLALIMLLI